MSLLIAVLLSLVLFVCVCICVFVVVQLRKLVRRTCIIFIFRVLFELL